MKSYFWWSILALSALTHGFIFYWFRDYSFYGLQKVFSHKNESEITIRWSDFSKKEEDNKTFSTVPTGSERENSVQNSSTQDSVKSFEETILSRSYSFEMSHLENLKAKLFGTSNEGYRFIYLLDVSGSMREKVNSSLTRLSLAKLEIQRSLEGLPETAEFNIILFADKVDLFSSECVPATRFMKTKASNFLEKETSLSGVTDIAGGLGAALAQWPDVIFLMTDGISNLSEEAFRSQWQYLYRQSKSQSKISIIGFLLDSKQESLLREIADFTQGKFWHWRG